jgi:hypothetical protein
VRDVDWSELERKNLKKKPDDQQNSFKIETKKVAVTKDQLRKLPDGTVIVVDKSKTTDK